MASVRRPAAGYGVLLICLSLVLAGCGNDPHPRALRETRPDGSPWLVRYSYIPDSPRSLDPQFAYDQMSRRILEPVIDCLLQYDPFKTDPYEVVPCLLARMPERVTNADGTVTYRCELKRGILFHDDACFPGGRGREVVAEDVHFTFQRLCDPKVECPVSSVFAEYIPGMAEAYAAAKKSGDIFDYSQRLPGLEVVDSHRFNIHLKKPYPQIIYWLAMHFTAPVAREATLYYDGLEHPDGPAGKMVRRPTFRWHPVGTGPFRIHEDSEKDQRFRLVRNESYRTTAFPTAGWPAEKDALIRPLAGKALPLLDEVQITVFRETIPAFLLARQGYLDNFGVSKDAFSSVVSATNELTPQYRARGIRLEKDTDVSTFYTSINMQDPLLGKNKKLRQALACAFDSQGENEIFFNGVREVAQQLISPGIYGFQKNYRNPYGFDLDRAQKLIAEAGYPGGRDPATGQSLEITMDVTATGADERLMAEFEQKCYERLGIRVRVLENTFARMLEKEDQGNFQLAAGTGWGADYPDPENYFMLFYGKNLPPQGKNISRYVNPEFDRLFEQMATTENSPERLEIVHRLNAILAEDCPVIYTNHKAFYSMVLPWAPRIHSNMMLEGGLKYLVADPAMRAQKQREWNPVARWPIGVGVVFVVAALGYAAAWNRKRTL